LASTLAKSHPLKSSVAQFALAAFFVVPLLTGVFLAGSSVNRREVASRISHDIGGMYAQGMDFAQPANRAIAERVTESLGIRLEEGRAVIILTKVRMPSEADCEGCTNLGIPVVVQRLVMGNAALRASGFGTPRDIDPGTGNVRNWATDITARAADFPGAMKPGESTTVTECFVASEGRSGVYSRTLE
jgi:hypothetical protein